MKFIQKRILRTKQDTTRQDKTRQDKTRRDETRRDETRRDKTRFYLYKLRHTGVQEDITNSHSI